MAAILIKEKTTDLTFVLQKLSGTINIYTERYPELLYISSGIKLIKQNTSEAEDVDFLVSLNNYIKEKLLEYYVIKILQRNLFQDIQLLVAGTKVNREKEFYLDFLD